VSALDILRSIGVHGGDCLEMLRAMPADSVASCACDPPYELTSGGDVGFMGKRWDGTGVSFDPATWAEVLRVLKPGAHLVAFGGTRTVHRIAVAIEDAGFQVRDTLHWCYWSGFPKSLDVSKAIDRLHGAEREVVGASPWNARKPNGSAGVVSVGLSATPGAPTITAPATDDARKWAGFGSGIKPAIEPAILARKPLSESSIARNVLRWGTGALNVDGCRFRPGDPMWPGPQDGAPTLNGRSGEGHREWFDTSPQVAGPGNPGGRFPANLLYCPKASRAERELGCEGLPARKGHEAVERTEGSAGLDNPRAGAGRTADAVRNFHPCVKPVRLLRWSVRLVTPPGGTVLDPFAGSGSCGVAATLEGFGYIGAELEPDYVQIARSRLAHARAYPTSWAHTAPGFVGDASDEIERAIKAGQLGMFS